MESVKVSKVGMEKKVGVVIMDNKVNILNFSGEDFCKTFPVFLYIKEYKN